MLMERIAVFHPEGNIADNPHLSALVQVLYAHGYAVDIFSWHRPDIAYQPKDLPEHIRLFLLPRQYHFCEWAERYVLAIGVDDGLIYARNQAEFLGIPYAHISYELLFDDELSAYPRLQSVKNKTRLAARNICFAIIQDAVRAEHYAREYLVARDRIIIMPVAGADAVAYQKSRHLHSLLNVPTNKKILLQMGSLTSWSMTDWLLAHAHTMPENWVLVLHGRYGPGDYAAVDKPERVYYTAEPAKNFAELQPVVQSADCCTALYQPEKCSPSAGKNIQFVGLASGKFSTALQYGVPVMVRHNSMMGDLIQEYGAGITINVDENLSRLNMLDRLDNIHAACYKLFTERLSINNHTNSFLDRIAQNKKTPDLKKHLACNTEYAKETLLYCIDNVDKYRAITLYFFMLKTIFCDAMTRIKRLINCILNRKNKP